MGRFTIEAQYLLDLSFESPKGLLLHPPALPLPDINVNVTSHHLKDKGEYEVRLQLQMRCEPIVDGVKHVAWLLEMLYGGVFTIQGFHDTEMPIILLVECPRLLYPYARGLVSTVLHTSGWPALNLPLIDFVKLYEQHQQLSTPPVSTALN
jgi:preprotein translocase subunit SecB